MLRETIITIAFLIILSGVVASFIVIQKTSSAQLVQVEKVIKDANEAY